MTGFHPKPTDLFQSRTAKLALALQNPYRPPKSDLELVQVEPPLSRTFSGQVAAAFVVVAALCYGSFTALLLLASNGPDFYAGVIWLINIPVLLLWTIFLFRNSKWHYQLGYLAALVQVGICAAMLAADIGDVELIVFVNACVVVGFVALAVACRFTIGRAQRPDINAAD